MNLPNSSNHAKHCAHIVHAICLAFRFDSSKPQCPQCNEEWKHRSWSSLNQNASPTEKFCNDEEYRLEQLKNNSWLTEDAELNKALFLAIRENEYWNIDIATLPAPFLEDICSLLKFSPCKAASFFSKDREGRAIPYLEDYQIAKYYGEIVCNRYPLGVYGKLEKSPELQEKLLKSVIINFDSILNQGIDGKIKFVCKLLEQAERFNSPEERTKEHTKMLNLLHEIAFDWDAYFSKFHQYLQQNDRIISKHFITLYVRDAFKRVHPNVILKALFGPGKNNGIICSFVVGQLAQEEKTKLKNALVSLNVYNTYASVF